MHTTESVFYNRFEEFKMLEVAKKNGGLFVFYGRRRVGKSRFLREFASKNNGVYFQALKTTTIENLKDLWQTIDPLSEMAIVNWKSFFEALESKIIARKISFLIKDGVINL